MTATDQLELRVNGILATGLRIQHATVDGYPSNQWEVLVEDPVIGYFPLDDKPDFTIEVRKSKRHRWQQKTLPELLSWLQSLGVIPEQ